MKQVEPDTQNGSMTKPDSTELRSLACWCRVFPGLLISHALPQNWLRCCFAWRVSTRFWSPSLMNVFLPCFAPSADCSSTFVPSPTASPSPSPSPSQFLFGAFAICLVCLLLILSCLSFFSSSSLRALVAPIDHALLLRRLVPLLSFCFTHFPSCCHCHYYHSYHDFIHFTVWSVNYSSLVFRCLHPLLCSSPFFISPSFRRPLSIHLNPIV